MTKESHAAMASFAGYGVDMILRWPGVEEVSVHREIDSTTIRVRYSGRESEVTITHAQLVATDNPWLLLKDLRAAIHSAAGVAED